MGAIYSKTQSETQQWLTADLWSSFWVFWSGVDLRTKVVQNSGRPFCFSKPGSVRIGGWRASRRTNTSNRGDDGSALWSWWPMERGVNDCDQEHEHRRNGIKESAYRLFFRTLQFPRTCCVELDANLLCPCRRPQGWSHLCFQQPWTATDLGFDLDNWFRDRRQ